MKQLVSLDAGFETREKLERDREPARTREVLARLFVSAHLLAQVLARARHLAAGERLPPTTGLD